MKLLVMGFGSIGERHARNLASLGHKVLVFDSAADRLRYAWEKYGFEVFEDLSEALEQKPKAVFVCTPSSLHLKHANAAVMAGADVFVEKPLFSSLTGVDDFLSLAHKKDRIVMVGCNLRFLGAMQKIEETISSGVIGKPLYADIQFGYYLPDWRPNTDYKRSYSANKSMGGGIILDAIHEIDYALWLLGDFNELSCKAGKYGDLDIDVEDSASILANTKGGCLVNIHMDYLRRAYKRTCEVCGTEGIVKWDWNERKVKVYRVEAKKWKEEVFETDLDVNNMYVKEIKHFLDSVQSRSQPLGSGQEAKRALEVALAAKRSADEGKSVRI